MSVKCKCNWYYRTDSISIELTWKWMYVPWMLCRIEKMKRHVGMAKQKKHRKKIGIMPYQQTNYFHMTTLLMYISTDWVKVKHKEVTLM